MAFSDFFKGRPVISTPRGVDTGALARIWKKWAWTEIAE